MTLYLTSDEKLYGSTNTRTDFDNTLQQDFFVEKGNNIALNEIFFYAKFPTLINNSYPHVVKDKDRIYFSLIISYPSDTDFQFWSNLRKLFFSVAQN